MATTLQPASATSRMAATKTSRSAPIHGGPAHLALDAEQPIVLGDTLRPRRRPGLELAAIDGDHEVGDEGVLGLPAAVADHRVVPVGTAEGDCLEGLGEGADLVELDQDRVGRSQVDPL